MILLLTHKTNFNSEFAVTTSCVTNATIFNNSAYKVGHGAFFINIIHADLNSCGVTCESTHIDLYGIIKQVLLFHC